MKRVVFFLFICLFLTACQNEQQRFCEDASTSLCRRCESCGGDYKLCGLNRVTSRDECISTLKTICAAYDAKYTQEKARLCLQSLNSLTCEQLKSEGKSEFCTSLF